MPVDPNSFVLGRGGAGWDMPSTGWWNQPHPSVGPGYVGGGFGGYGVSGGGGAYQAPTFHYTGASGVSPAAGMDLTSLTRYMNQLNREGQTAALRARIPRSQALEEASSRNITSELAGTVPPDVMRLLQQQAAERGVAGGIPGSDNESAAYLRALGLTSLDRMATGQRDLSAALARNPAAPLFDPTTQLLTPYQSGQLALEGDRLALEREAEQNRLALALAPRGGGGYGGGGAYGYNNPITATSDGGYGGEYLAPSLATGGPTGRTLSSANEDLQQRWWESIGYGSPTSETAEDVMGYLGWDPGAAPAGTRTTSTGSSAPGIDWGSLFSQDLGIEPALYGG